MGLSCCATASDRATAGEGAPPASSEARYRRHNSTSCCGGFWTVDSTFEARAARSPVGRSVVRSCGACRPPFPRQEAAGGRGRCGTEGGNDETRRRVLLVMCACTDAGRPARRSSSGCSCWRPTATYCSPSAWSRSPTLGASSSSPTSSSSSSSSPPSHHAGAAPRPPPPIHTLRAALIPNAAMEGSPPAHAVANDAPRAVRPDATMLTECAPPPPTHPRQLRRGATIQVRLRQRARRDRGLLRGPRGAG